MEHQCLFPTFFFSFLVFFFSLCVHRTQEKKEGHEKVKKEIYPKRKSSSFLLDQHPRNDVKQTRGCLPIFPDHVLNTLVAQHV